MIQQVMLSEFDLSYLPTLARWLEKPHVRQWYPDPSSNLEWASDLPEGGAQALILVGEDPIGYIRWQLVSRDVLDSVGLNQIPDNSADIDILIGEEDYISKGIGTLALSILTSRLAKQGGIPLLALTSSCENTVAHKAFIKCGFEKSAVYSSEGYGECFLFSKTLNH